jgi:hypothetical protein
VSLTDGPTHVRVAEAALVPGFRAAFLAGARVCVLALFLSGAARNKTGAETPEPAPVTTP